jgi:hypothetical protein
MLVSSPTDNNFIRGDLYIIAVSDSGRAVAAQLALKPIGVTPQAV